MLIAVYGSLRKDNYNHRYFDMGELKCRHYVSGRLYSLGAYPALSPDEDGDPVEVEVYDVSPETFYAINGMELGAGYYSSILPTPEGDATIWYMDEERFHDDEFVSVLKPEEDGFVRWPADERGRE